MRFLKIGIKKIILEADTDGLTTYLSTHAHKVHQEIQCGINSTVHPLHYLCDCVFEGKITDEKALSLAKIFIKHGSKIDGNNKVHLKDTPLVAATSLHADSLAILYIDHGADIHHQGCHGGTPLHWAAWTGADTVVEHLLQFEIPLNKLCSDFGSTALFWGFHGYKNGGDKNRRNQYRCCQLLLQAGADAKIPNIEKTSIEELLNEKEDGAYLSLLHSYNI